MFPTGEAPLDRLLREALEYQELFHSEFGSSAEVKLARVAAIEAEIEATGAYVHTFDEMQHGVRERKSLTL
jgi:nitric-oxide synthase